MPTEYVPDKDVEAAVVNMIADEKYAEFEPLRVNEVKIVTCVVVRTNNEGENQPCKGDPTAVKKVPAVERLFLDVDYIITINYTAWSTANDQKQQDAMIHRSLMKIQIDTNDNGIKMSTKKPTITEFPETWQRFGPCTEPQLSFRDVVLLGANHMAKELQLEN